MIRLGDCDSCRHCRGMTKGHIICDAFPDGVPHEHAYKDLKHLSECNNGIGYEEKGGDQKGN